MKTPMPDDLDRFCGKPVAEMSREELIEQLDVTHSLMMTAFMVAGKAQRQLDRYHAYPVDTYSYPC